MPLPRPRSAGPRRRLLPAAIIAFHARPLIISWVSGRAGVSEAETRQALRGSRVRAAVAAALEAVLLL